ncbi:MAG: sulfite exporter TauE/SafE family protein [Candidatus Riflebacteria bacterium]|nr:sulfite exporter TauE/SafE family protein [Candidatus Riflebacteria bacterium]
MIYLAYLAWGGIIGIISGILGIGGGILIIPTLIFMFGLSQHQAQGTSLAMMVPPIGLMAAYRYYQEGNVILPIAIIGAIGFFLGGYFGAGFAQAFTDLTLKRAFGVLLIFVGLRMLFVR